mmetsp:Transcript_86383/g.196991  ORF Transcript_86383/g.196991 Transcript_86383/m.196991 type:complete len:274 (-) Transcript_86383:234-1055(-)
MKRVSMERAIPLYWPARVCMSSCQFCSSSPQSQVLSSGRQWQTLISSCVSPEAKHSPCASSHPQRGAARQSLTALVAFSCWPRFQQSNTTSMIPSCSVIILSICWVKTMATTYIIRMSRPRVVATDLVAAFIPFTRVSNSGTLLINRTIRVSRSSRSRRRNVRSLSPPLLPTNAIIQVSVTINTAKQESKTNQASLRHLLLSRNAAKRTQISIVKYAQKKFSIITNWGAASNNMTSLLWSVSYPIHTAFSAIIPRVTISNPRDRATRATAPSV